MSRPAAHAERDIAAAAAAQAAAESERDRFKGIAREMKRQLAEAKAGKAAGAHGGVSDAARPPLSAADGAPLAAKN